MSIIAPNLGLNRGGCQTTACCKPVSESEKCFALPIKYVTTTHAYVAQPICVSQRVSDIKPVNVKFISDAKAPELRDFYCDIQACGTKPGVCGPVCGTGCTTPVSPCGGGIGDLAYPGYNGGVWL